MAIKVSVKVLTEKKEYPGKSYEEIVAMCNDLNKKGVKK